LEKFIVDMVGKVSNNKNIPLIPLLAGPSFHYSMCGAKTAGPEKLSLISCCCANSEALIDCPNISLACLFSRQTGFTSEGDLKAHLKDVRIALF
jgi:hypothetical protein